MSKLTREEKIEIFERRKMGETISSLTKAFNIRESNIKYLIALIKKHGYNILREDKNRVYSKDFKLQAINRILNDNFVLEEYKLESITGDTDAQAQVVVIIEKNRKRYIGRAQSTDIVEASIKAYINALNRLYQN